MVMPGLACNGDVGQPRRVGGNPRGSDVAPQKGEVVWPKIGQTTQKGKGNGFDKHRSRGC